MDTNCSSTAPQIESTLFGRRRRLPPFLRLGAGVVLAAAFLLLLFSAMAAADPAASAPSAAAPAPVAQAVTTTQSSGIVPVLPLPQRPAQPEAEVIEEAELPDWVQDLMAQGEPRGVDTHEITVRKYVDVGNGSLVDTIDSPAVGENGRFITYTIVVTNNTQNVIRNLNLLDALPRGALQDIACLDRTCSYIYETSVISEPLGGNIVVSETRQISWTFHLPASNLSGDVPRTAVRRTFSARIVGQSDGSVIKNQAFASYAVGESDNKQSVSSNETQVVARVSTAAGVAASLSSAATWFSSDQGGTIGLDWGDFDGDGDLDLALASSVGTTIYRNNNGRLQRFWGNTRRSFGVRWGDYDGDGALELVAVGDGEQNQQSSNYVYRLAGTTFQETARFTSTHQLVRVVSGDFDGDGHLDLVVSTNTINAPCPVMLFRNDGSANFTYRGRNSGDCISEQATAAIGAGDFDNDDDLDLALGGFPNSVYLLRNDGEGRFGAAVSVDGSVPFLPYDFAWADYDEDGYLDLAAAYPLLRQARVYHNDQGDGFTRIATIRTDRFQTPFSVDWGDFDGDGRLDLAVADARPTVYSHEATASANGPFRQDPNLTGAVLSGQIWTLRGVDVDVDGDLDLTLADRNGPSPLFTNFASMLARDLNQVPSGSDRSEAPASSVAWGDLDGDGYLDLLFGGGPSALGQPTALATKLYYNEFATFERDDEQTLEGFGPHPLALGDVDGDGGLDLAIGTETGVSVYLAGNVSQADFTARLDERVSAVAWGDYDDDGDLDLLIATDGGAIRLYCNGRLQASPLKPCVGSGATNLSASPVWTSADAYAATSIAWADVNGDYYLDFALGVDGGPNRVFLSDLSTDATSNSFSPSTWSPSIDDATRAVAWGDYDGDGDLDLAVGNYGTANLIYQNTTDGSRPFRMGRTPIWWSSELFRTTSLAWGDWDNDGDLDLAVGNDGDVDQVYVNRRNGGTSDQPLLSWLWSSPQSQRTSGVAWGDVDLDGDLDLAVSQEGGGNNGYYENTLIRPAHLGDEFLPQIPLPSNLYYLSVDRPGETAPAYFYSAPQVFSGPKTPTVPITFRVYAPDGTRRANEANAAGTPLPMRAFQFAYSTDGGGSWRTATPAQPITPTDLITPTRLGTSATFYWDAQADAAIGEQTLFKVTLLQPSRPGFVKRPATAAVTPPFRVRGLTCIWPGKVRFFHTPNNPRALESTTFTAAPLQGSGVMTFTWHFGDGSTAVGQQVQHRFLVEGRYSVRLTVEGAPCPVSRSQRISQQVPVGSSTATHFLYAPLIANGGGAARSQRVSAQPVQVSGLQGAVQIGGVTLTWDPSEAAAGVQAYRIYRSRNEGAFLPLAQISTQTAFYRDEGVTCGAAYYVTAISAAGEGPVSTRTFYTVPCGGEDEDGNP